MEEGAVKQADVEDFLTQSIAALTRAVQVQNDILVVLLYNLDLKMPDWKSVKEADADITKKIEDCVRAVRKVYDEPGETNQS